MKEWSYRHTKSQNNYINEAGKHSDGQKLRFAHYLYTQRGVITHASTEAITVSYILHHHAQQPVI